MWVQASTHNNNKGVRISLFATYEHVVYYCLIILYFNIYLLWVQWDDNIYKYFVTNTKESHILNLTKITDTT